MGTKTQSRQRVTAVALQSVLAELAMQLGNRLVTSEAVRTQHANTLTWVDPEPPDAVAYPLSTEDIAQIVKTCARHRVPVIPFGTGTSFEGHVNAPFGGISIDTSMMVSVVAVHGEDLDVV